MNGYNLIRDWYNFKFDNPSKVKAIHSDFYCYLIDLWNRLGQKNEFGLPTTVTMEALGIGSYNTYKKTLSDIVEFGFIKIIVESKNQHKSKVIALSKNDKATDKALDKATIKATDKASDETPDTIIKQINNETNKQINNNIESFDFDGLLVFINSTFGKNFKLINDKVKKKYKALMKQGYDKKQIVKAMINAKENSYHKETNYQYCTPEFFSRTETIDKYSEIAIKQKSNNVIDNYYGL
jgi:hypothetical protein